MEQSFLSDATCVGKIKGPVISSRSELKDIPNGSIFHGEILRMGINPKYYFYYIDLVERPSEYLDGYDHLLYQHCYVCHRVYSKEHVKLYSIYFDPEHLWNVTLSVACSGCGTQIKNQIDDKFEIIVGAHY